VLVGDSREFPSFSFLSTSHKERCSVYFWTQWKKAIITIEG
jgi:hypothetical protein